MKKCFVCKEEKEIDKFYSHKGMSDGHLGKCKECCKHQADIREKKLRESSEFVESERTRHRNKYHRLGYKEIHKPTFEEKIAAMNKYRAKYPEKEAAKRQTRKIVRTKGSHLHHWSYNLKDAKDVIELSVAEHNLLHRFLVYDQTLYLYRDLEGNLLESAQAHIDLLNSLRINNEKYNNNVST